jgi:hypothetical protein
VTRAAWKDSVLVLELETADGHRERTSVALSADKQSLICDGEVREHGRGGMFRFVFQREKPGSRSVAPAAEQMHITVRRG